VVGEIEKIFVGFSAVTNQHRRGTGEYILPSDAQKAPLQKLQWGLLLSAAYRITCDQSNF
jgi:hypothetical protein